ncbi:MAG: hypothetical protein QXX91_01735 [Thermoplasmata archaeon]
MGEILEEKCGVCLAYSLHDVYSMMKSLQHRGRGAAGIAAISKNRIDVIKWSGIVNSFDINDMYKIFPATNHYHFFMGHVRYPTKGKIDNTFQDAHPHVIGGNTHERNDHLLITNCEMAIIHNGQINERYFENLNRKEIKTECDSALLLHYYAQYGEIEIQKNIPGAYTLAIADKKRENVIVMRDRTGIKPGSIGWKDGKYQMASEDRAFLENGGRLVKEMKPGDIYYFDINGTFKRVNVTDQKLKFCFFEPNYLAHHESTFNGASVNSIRNALGERLGVEFIQKFRGEKIDYVSYLPRCPEPAARGFSRVTDIPFEEVFYKIRAERSFQGPNPQERTNSIKRNLNLTPRAIEILPEKAIVIVDDSIIRGTNVKKAKELLYEEAKAKKVFFVSYTPPIGIIGQDKEERGCEYGVDMPKNDTFIIRNEKENRNKTIEELSEEIGIEVFYISEQGMKSVHKRFGLNPKKMCYYCIGGEKPF